MKLLEENTVKTCQNLGKGDNFLGRRSKAQEIEQKWTARITSNNKAFAQQRKYSTDEGLATEWNKTHASFKRDRFLSGKYQELKKLF